MMQSEMAPLRRVRQSRQAEQGASATLRVSGLLMLLRLVKAEMK